MWLVILLVLEWYLLVKFWSVLFIFVALVYVLYVIDGAWLSGVRTWKHFRELSIWKRITPVKYHLPDGYNDVFGTENSERRRFIFIVIPNFTNAPLIWGFGLHSGVMHSSLKVKYMLPKFMFYFPIIRDVLMWSGAVGFEAGKEFDTINELVNNGNSVAYSCNGMEDILNIEQEFSVNLPKEELFQFAIQKNLSIVPVVVSGESDQYLFLKWGYLRRIQTYFYRICNYPWPIISLPTRKKCMHIQILSPLHAHLYDNSKTMKAEFKLCITRANNTTIDRKLTFNE